MSIANYEFMFVDYRGDDLWLYDQKRRREARARGLIFSPEELDAILKFWADLIKSPQRHDIDRLSFDTISGGRIEITPRSIRSNDTSPEGMRAVMQHLAAWECPILLSYEPGTTSDIKLMIRAYAQVYGIELTDRPEDALTSAEEARLPALRRDIRAAHPDAPPERPDEAEKLAATYAARFPFRTPRAA